MIRQQPQAGTTVAGHHDRCTIRLAVIRQHKPVIGLVGGIGSGKSLVAQQLQKLGCGVIDADHLAQDALDQPAVRRKLMDWWGQTVIGDDGRVDRDAVARIVFDQPRELRRLEDLVHPIVREKRLQLRKRLQQDPGIVAIVEDCPLLIEKGIDAQCDAVVLVEASRDTRLRRLAQTRGWSEAEVGRREKNQVGLDKKGQRADHIISNDAGEDDCLTHVRRVLSKILQAPPSN